MTLVILLALLLGQGRDALQPEPMSFEYRDIAARADAYFTALAQTKRFSGSVLLHRGQWTILKKGYGMANYEWDNPNTPSTKFRLGSLGRQFVAVAIMQLAERGKVHVDDAAGKYLSDYHGTATIHELLSDPSGAGYTQLGEIVQKLDRWSYQRFVEDNILRRAGMASSGYERAREVVKNRASGYEMHGGEPAKAPDQDPDGMYSTVEDLYLWDLALSRNTVVSEQTLPHIFNPWVDVAGMGAYGYGWATFAVRGHRSVAGGGEASGFASYISRFPDENAMFAYLCNVTGSLPASINEDVTGILFGERIDPPPIPAKDPGGLTGAYALTPEIRVTVTRQGEHLFARGPGLLDTELLPLANEMRFALRTSEAEIEFVRNDTGAVDHIVLHRGGKVFTGRKVR